MSGDSGGNQEFVEQLRLQELYGQRRDDGGDPYTYTDPEDGTVYDWDHDKKAWFPKITEDFIAAYQASYGFSDDGAPAAAGEVQPEKQQEEKQQEKVQESTTTKEEEKKKGEKRKAEPGWFDIEKDKNTNVYVSGLPLDITPDEFVELMSKCGIIMRDPMTEEYKIKLYKDGEGNQKGDGLCCYLKKESVALAERLLDEYEVRGYRLHVEAARFELKGQYDASRKKKKNKEYRKKLQQQQKQLDWRPEKKGEVRKRHERVVIIQNMFHPTDFEEDPLVLNEYRDDLRLECEKFGEVKKVIIFDRHPDGVASVAFSQPEEADLCVSALNTRWFGGRQLLAQLWDGVTDYQVDETVREREERLKGWSSFLGEEAAEMKRLEEKGATKETKQQEEKEVDEKEVDEKEVDEKEADEKEADEKEADEKEADEKEADEKEADEKEADEKEADEKEVEEKEKEVEEKEEEEDEKEATIESTDSSLVGSDDES